MVSPALYTTQRSQISRTAAWLDHPKVYYKTERPSSSVPQSEKQVTEPKNADKPALSVLKWAPLQWMPAAQWLSRWSCWEIRQTWTSWQVVYRKHHTLFVCQERIRSLNRKMGGNSGIWERRISIDAHIGPQILFEVPPAKVAFFAKATYKEGFQVGINILVPYSTTCLVETDTGPNLINESYLKRHWKYCIKLSKRLSFGRPRKNRSRYNESFRWL